MLEQSKAAKRRFYNGNFHNRYFNGRGIDVGGAPDPFSQYIGVFPLVKEVKIWDLEDGDAQYMESCSENQYDFLVSSHCLEHMVDVFEAFFHWIRIVKPGGYLTITIPDEDMYEQENWPSKYNGDHKWTFTISKKNSWSEKSINVLDFLKHFSNQIEIEKIEVIKEFYNFNIKNEDQTLHPNIESCIEFIVKKRDKEKIVPLNNRFWLNLENNNEQKLEFSRKYSKIFEEIEKLKESKNRFVIYGSGSFGNTLFELLKENVVSIVDIKSDVDEKKNIDLTQVYSPEILKSLDFDFILVSVLGREEEINNYLINELSIDSFKIHNFK